MRSCQLALLTESAFVITKYHVGTFVAGFNTFTDNREEEQLKCNMAGDVRFDIADVAIHNEERQRPKITYLNANESHEVACDYIAGCDADRVLAGHLFQMVFNHI